MAATRSYGTGGVTSEDVFTIVLELDEVNATDTRVFYGNPVVVPLSLLMVIFIVLAIAGNIMVIMTVVRHRGMRTRTNMFIVNLAVADILVAVLDMPVSLTTILAGDWVFGRALCLLNGFTMALFLICSIHTLMYISINKYFSITRPFSRAMTPRRVKIMIGATWIWATICAIGPLLGWNQIIYKKGASQCGPDIPRDTGAKLHSLFITTSNYIIPLAVMIFCYFRIFREIRLHMGRIRETSNINLASSVKQQKKISVTLFLVLLCFFLCWTPFVVYSTIASFMKDKERMPYIVNPLAYWCGYLNSACNPIIYAFRSPSFRKGYKEIMCGQSATGLDASHSLSIRSNRGSLKINPDAEEGGAGTRFRAVRPHHYLEHRDEDPVVHLPGNLASRNGQEEAEPETRRRERPRKMLSQTSWISLPMIPYLVRSFSSVKGDETLRRRESADENSEVGVCQACFCLECRRKNRRRRSSASETGAETRTRKMGVHAMGKPEEDGFEPNVSGEENSRTASDCEAYGSREEPIRERHDADEKSGGYDHTADEMDVFDEDGTIADVGNGTSDFKTEVVFTAGDTERL